MEHLLKVFNSLSRKKEVFTPIHPEHVGMYVCGPTVYGDPHLGHARPGITFDIVYRYLQHLGYNVRYVRNITDVGHLENDADEGEDKIAKKARLEQLEPMEVAQYYTNRYHKFMQQLNMLSPSIEPHASGHIMEQLEVIDKIFDAGYAYEAAGSVYFDVEKYNKKHSYGILSGRNVEEMLANTRELEGQTEKRNSFDFALWKKASPIHIMRWKSKWSEGFPGWHLECTAMGAKYLGETFDIHGGGMDLLFPHHESEIAQSMAAFNKMPVKYWMHNNMITINGQKMGKSLGNFITLEEFFTGKHELLEHAHSPMAIRFFILQAHYRGTVDFSDKAVSSAGKAYERLLKAFSRLDSIKTSDAGSLDMEKLRSSCYEAMNDDFNTPILIAHLFDAVKFINAAADGKTKMSEEQKIALQNIRKDFCVDILGLKMEETKENSDSKTDDLMQLLVDLRSKMKTEKNYAMSDYIRDELTAKGIVLKDTKDGTEWEM